MRETDPPRSDVSGERGVRPTLGGDGCNYLKERVRTLLLLLLALSWQSAVFFNLIILCGFATGWTLIFPSPLEGEVR